MVGGLLSRSFATVLVTALCALGLYAQAIPNGDSHRCTDPVLAGALAVAVDMKPVEAEIVSQSQRFHLVEPLLALYLKYDPRAHLGRRLYGRLAHSRYADTVAQDVEPRSLNLVVQESQRNAFTEHQMETLGLSLADVLRWRDRREASLHSANAFLAHLDRALLKRLEKIARDTLRSENKRRNALRDQLHYRETLERMRARTVTSHEEGFIRVPFLAKIADFKDEFERVVFDALFRDGRTKEWALCTAGESLRVVLAHGDREPSADVLAFHRTSQSLYMIEIKRSPTGFSHAIEQLEETHAHLRRNGVHIPIHAAVAFPEDMEMHEPFRQGRFGDLLRNNRPVYVADRPVQVMRF